MHLFPYSWFCNFTNTQSPSLMHANCLILSVKKHGNFSFYYIYSTKSTISVIYTNQDTHRHTQTLPQNKYIDPCFSKWILKNKIPHLTTFKDYTRCHSHYQDKSNVNICHENKDQFDKDCTPTICNQPTTEHTHTPILVENKLQFIVLVSPSTRRVTILCHLWSQCIGGQQSLELQQVYAAGITGLRIMLQGDKVVQSLERTGWSIHYAHNAAMLVGSSDHVMGEAVWMQKSIQPSQYCVTAHFNITVGKPHLHMKVEQTLHPIICLSMAKQFPAEMNSLIISTSLSHNQQLNTGHILSDHTEWS